jgi:hypothetical protein
MQALLTTRADELARSCGFVRRARKVTGANFAQALVFTALADPEAPESRLHATAALVGLTASRQALDKRFTPAAAEFLRGLLAAAVAQAVATPVTLPLLRRFAAVVVLDSSVVALADELADLYRGGRSGTTATAKAAVKLTVGLDLVSGALRGPELSAGRAADLSATLATADPPPGHLQIADQSYFSLTKFARWSRSGAFWLSRLKAGTAVYDPKGRRIDLVGRLGAAGVADVDLDVTPGSQERSACRLIARRVPADVAAARRARLRETCRRRGNAVSALSLALCDWTVLVTNVPRDLLSVAEAIALARLRWQIELIFKLWKSVGRIDEFRRTRPYEALCELYAKLLAQVVRHWVIVVGAWSRRDRSLVKAAAIVRTMALSLAAAVGSVRRLRRVLSQVRQMMEIAARMDRRRAAPNAHDRIFGLDPGP